MSMYIFKYILYIFYYIVYITLYIYMYEEFICKNRFSKIVFFIMFYCVS